MNLTPELAVFILSAPPSPMRDRVRRDYLEQAESELVLEWLLLAADVIAKKHPAVANDVPNMVAEILGVRRAAIVQMHDPSAS